jgi:hypothetical protein
MFFAYFMSLWLIKLHVFRIFFLVGDWDVCAGREVE